MELGTELADEQHYNADYISINNYHHHNGEGGGNGTLLEPWEQHSTQMLHICFGIVYSLIGLAGVFGNGLVVYVFSRSPQAKEEGTNSLILSLSANDLMVSACQFISVYSAFTQPGMVGPIGCGLYGALMGIGTVISTLTSFGIVLSQFCAVYGFSVVWWANERTCRCIWALSFILICPPFLGWSEFALEGIGISCSINWKTREFFYNYFYILLRLISLVISLIFLIATYVGIHRLGVESQHTETRLVSASSTPNVNANANNPGTAINMPNEACHRHEQDSVSQMLTMIHPPTQAQHKLLQMVLIMLSCLILSWVPYLIINMIEQFSVSSDSDETSSVPALVTTGASVFAKLNVICNPVIYILFHPEFRGLLVLSLQTNHTANSAAYKHSMVPSIVENSGCDFRRPSSGAGLHNFNSYNRANSIPGSRITPSNSICQSHASFNSHHSRYHRQSSTSQDRSRSGSGTSEMARSSITSGGRRPTISSSNTFRQNRTNSSCSSSSAAATLPSSFSQAAHHRPYIQYNVARHAEDSLSQSREDWNSRTSQEILLHKFGWAIQRRPSNCASSSGNSSTVLSPSRQHSSRLIPKAAFQSGNGMTKASHYSEPDLPRFSDRIIKNAGLIPFREYKRRKTEFWRKSLFLSENCLESLCSSRKLLERNSPVLCRSGGTSEGRSRSRTPSPTTSQGSFTFEQQQRRSSAFFVDGTHHSLSNALSVPNSSTSPARVQKTGNGKLVFIPAGPNNLPSRSKSMRATTRSGTSHKFLELPARFKRHSDGGVYTSTSSPNSTSPTVNGFSSRKQSQYTVDFAPTKERSNSKDSGRRKESSIIMVTSPCGDTASVKMESFEMNEVDDRNRKFSEISSQYHGMSRNSSKKLSFELGSTKNEWKYSLIHQRECCDCSSSGCHQDQYCPSDDLP